jgi:hypothetical protein
MPLKEEKTGRFGVGTRTEGPTTGDSPRWWGWVRHTLKKFETVLLRALSVWVA